MINHRVISFIIQALAVIVGVFLFSFFDPFNIFNSKKLRMKDTPTVVAEIRAMGKLITAEYYGEVIKSTGEALIESIDSVKKEHKSRLSDVYDDLLQALQEIKIESDKEKEGKLNRWQIYNRLKTNYDHIVNNPDYDILIHQIRSKSGGTERVIVRDLYFGDRQIDATTFFDDYLKKEYDLTKRQERKISNHSIVLLGRGWVKAGIDLSEFDEKHLDYKPEKNLIRLYYHEPEIISATINPWFIPEKKIKGFEYLFVGKKIDRHADEPSSVDISTNLKAQCLQDLRSDALAAGILQAARENAESTLTGFFSLILDRDIKVEILDSPLQPELNSFLSKQFTSADLITVDTLVSQYLKKDSAGTFGFLRGLSGPLHKKKQLIQPWGDTSRNWNWSAYAMYYSIAQDKFFSDVERDSMRHFIAKTSVTLKDWMYWSMNKPGLADSLAVMNFDITKMDKKAAAGLALAKLHDIEELEMAASAFRSNMNSTELDAADRELSKLVESGDLKKAYEFITTKSHLVPGNAPWKHADHNWEMLSFYFHLYNPGYKLPDTIQRSAPKELLYYMFYDSNLAEIMQKKTSRDNFQTIMRSKKIPPELSQKLDKEFKRNVDSLRARAKSM
jgi:hypothetical protein